MQKSHIYRTQKHVRASHVNLRLQYDCDYALLHINGNIITAE